jgi:hypothetical protein
LDAIRLIQEIIVEEAEAGFSRLKGQGALLTPVPPAGIL